MKRLTSVYFCLTLLSAILSPINSGPVAAGQAKERTFTDVLKGDTVKCENAKELFPKYAEECMSLTYPEINTPVNKDDANSFICIEIFDSINSFCSGPAERIIKFNEEIERNEKTKIVDQEAACEALNNNPEGFSVNERLMEYQNFLRTFKKRCTSICSDSIFAFNGLCATLVYVRKASLTVHEKEKEDSKQPAAIKDPSVGANKAKETTTFQEDNKKNSNADASLPSAQQQGTTGQENKVKPAVTEAKVQKSDESSKVKQGDQPAPVKDAADVVMTEPKVDSNLPEKSEVVQQPSGNDNPLSVDKTPTQNDNGQVDDNTNAEDYQQSPSNSELPFDIEGAADSALRSNEQINAPNPVDQRKAFPYRDIMDEEESHFFTYFTVASFACLIIYVGFHNKQKILAIMLEGRRTRGSRARRRPSTANYRKLDCTLEEAVTSQCNSNVTHVIY